MMPTSGQITGLVSGLAGLAALLGQTGWVTFLNDPHLTETLMGLAALLAPLAGHLPGATQGK